jgi:hypothetical protein
MKDKTQSKSKSKQEDVSHTKKNETPGEVNLPQASSTIDM